MTKNRTCGILLVIFGVIFAMVSFGFNSTIDSSDPGPKLFPLIGCGGMIICGIGIFFQKSAEKWPVFLEKTGWKKLGLQIALLIAYVFCIKWIGFLISTPVILFIFTTLYDMEHKVSILKRVVYSLLVTAAIYLVFVKVLLVMLPSGNLF